MPAGLGAGYGRSVEPKVLVLLGCRVLGPAELTPPAMRRAERVLREVEAGYEGLILACGGKAWGGVCEADALCEYLMARGVKESRLERELYSRSTRQNAHYAAELLFERGIRQIGLVTCDFHMDRALCCFRGAGFQVDPLPAATPPKPMRSELYRSARERVCFELDRLVTRNFSRV